MLILPLHQPITRRNLPLATLLLVLCNVWVFVVLQGGDAARRERLDAFYWQSGMADTEAPLFAAHLAEHPDTRLASMRDALPADQHPRLEALWRQRDDAFRQRLARGELFASATAWQAWQPAAQRFDHLRAEIFSERWALEAAAPTPQTLLSAQFLHGDWGHLLGNMLFLLALGVLVEGPLGFGLFLLLYLTGGVVAGLAWLAGNLGGASSLVGASGAIAALMGAFCVLWGRRQVRFFYWFFVVFDYVRAPALLLLPAWLGWELLQWALRDGERVAYEAHAGGIVAGALLALLILRLRWQREAYFDAGPPGGDADAGADLRPALEHLARFRLGEAEAALAAIARRQPGRLDVAIARYRCARYAKDAERAAAHAADLLRRAPASVAEAQEQASVLADWLGAGGRPDNALRRSLAPRLLAQGDIATAIRLCREWEDAAGEPGEGAQLLLSVALGLQQRGADAEAVALLRELASRYPQTAQAGKAAFLIGEWAR
jgi:membrane associated rhomboid family serine protease